MKVSIITSCYNRVGTIRDTIESVLNQDYPDIEYIIIDGASTDGSLSVINEYEKKLTKIVSEPDQGMYEALNKGLRFVSGEVVGLVHSDDMLYDTHIISAIVEEFEKTNADMVYGNGLFVDSKNTSKVIRNWTGGNYYRWKVKIGWLPLHPTCYIKKAVYAEVGDYDEKYKIAADTDFLFRALYGHRLIVHYLNRYIVRMRMGGISTDKAKRKAMWKEDIAIYSSYHFPGTFMKICKMMWKIPQFISAKFIGEKPFLIY
ncbi:glycosyltransferase family 2 protein [Prevotella sp. KH2C16]|uniref:glycosyltransferase family 2 protein n=1 Tax=Prevotella sp. KH2C16 TaxID=1855325 RepID=UPI0008ED6B40|nr:glycosyltransferase family 2 protein [Prevotella sp. KH2C16]SFG09001.1 glycosyltransferase [Prevotella sp. KH2C16]